MTAVSTSIDSPLASTNDSEATSWKHPLRKLGRGFFLVTHSSMALVGIGAVLSAGVLAAQPELRDDAAAHVVDWLTPGEAAQPALESLTADAAAVFASSASAVESTPVVPAATTEARFPATDPADLPRQQAAVTYWISKKYRVAPEPVGLLVKEAFAVGSQEKIDPSLILAIMAIESSFNPFAQSTVGAQGLMQVMTKIHSDKYADLGGNLAAFDPVSNLRVGVKVLKETIARAGSLRGGLKYYVGAANLPTDQGYGDKVLAEYARIQAVAQGRTVASNAQLPVKEPQAPKAASVKLAAAKPQAEAADGRKRTQIAAATMQASYSKRNSPSSVDGSAPLVQRALAKGNMKTDGARRLELARNDAGMTTDSGAADSATQ